MPDAAPRGQGRVQSNDGTRAAPASQPDHPLPTPPFPAPDNAILRRIIDAARASHTAGTLDLAGAITRAAIHAWFEGHIQGEDACPGCEFRGLVTETGVYRCGRCTPARYRELRRDQLMRSEEHT